jgi:hypothetical protein
MNKLNGQTERMFMYRLMDTLMGETYGQPNKQIDRHTDREIDTQTYIWTCGLGQMER